MKSIADEPTEYQLRRAIQQASAGATIKVPPGEHIGPFIFDRPIRLVGQDTQQGPPLLLAVRGPVVIVRSPKVSLENLELLVGDGEYRGIDSELVYAPNCMPDTKNVRIKGRIEDMGTANKTGGWNLPVIVDLGDLVENNRFSMPMVIRVPGPTSIKSQLGSMSVEPTRLSTAGDYVVHVRFDQGALMRGIMLAGQIVLDSQGESKALWVIGRVLSASEYSTKAQPVICLSSQSGRRFYFADTMVLGKAQFQSESAAGKLVPEQAHFVRDKANVWSIVQTSPQATATKINGQPLPLAHRTLLKGGDVIEAAGLRLTMEAKEKKSSLEVSGNLNFGKYSTARTAGGKLRLKNTSRSTWEGRLRSAVGWIQVPNEQVSCSGGQQVDIPLQLTMEAGKLPVMNHIDYGALVLEGSQESWLINASLEVDIAGPSVEIQPGVLDFGKLTDTSQAQVLKVTVRNTGSLDWEGNISPMAGLETSISYLKVAAGAEDSFMVSMRSDFPGLLEGPNSAPKAVVLDAQGIKDAIPCRFEYTRPKASLEVTPKTLAFGTVENWRQAKINLVLKNTGERDWRGRVVDKADWLELVTTGGQTVDEIKMAAQDELNLVAQLKESSWTLPPERQKTAKALRIVGEEKIELIFPASMKIQLPKIELDPGMLAYEVTKDSSSWERTFRLVNHGATEWQGKVQSTVPWLVVVPDEVRIPAGGEARATASIALKEAVDRYYGRSRKLSVDDAIELVESGNTIAQVEVSILVKEKVDTESQGPSIPVPEKSAERTTVVPPKPILNLGIFTNKANPPIQSITVTNVNPWPVKCTISSSLNWLAVEPKEVELGPNGNAFVNVTLSPKADPLPNDTYDEDEGLVIQMPGKRIAYAVQLKVDLPTSTPGAEKTAAETPVTIQDDKKSVSKVVYDIDFGLISSWPAKLPSKEITLENSSGLPVLGTASCRLGWLQVTPDRFTIPGKGTTHLVIGLAEEARKLAADDYHAEDAIILDIGGRKSWINVKLQVDKPPEIPEGPSIDFGKIWQKADKFPIRDVSITNPMVWEQPVRARATQDWLTVHPETLTCPGKHDCKVTVTLNKGVLNLPPGLKVAEKAVILTCGNQTQDYHVTLELVSQPVKQPEAPKRVQPEPSKAPQKVPPVAQPEKKGPDPKRPYIIDFGDVAEWSPENTSRSFRLTNSTSKPLDGKATVNNLSWLKVEPEQFRIDPGSAVDIIVQLTEEARGRYKKFNAEDAITLDYQGQKTPIQVTARILRSQGSVSFGVVSAPVPVREESKASSPAAAPAAESRKKPAENVLMVDLSKELEPSSQLKNLLNFGTVKSWSGEFPGREIFLGNSSNKTIKGTITAEVAWLDVAPAQFDCPPGGQVTLKVNLSQGARTMMPRPRPYRADDAICINTDDRKFCLLASVTIQATG
jgi:hypothetical protein